MTTPSLAERGRRAGAAALLVVVSAGVAQAIVTNPEPTSAALLGPAATVTTTPVPPAAASSPTPTAATPDAPPAAPTTTKPADPRALAVAWYAKRHGIDRAKVTALQADRLKGVARYRVLLLVTKPGGRLDSAVVTVTRSGGAWRVEASRG